MKFRAFTKILATLLIATLTLTACKGDSTVENRDGETGTTAAASDVLPNVPIYNFDPPVAGDKIAVIKVKDFGTIKIKLFPDVAEKGVENFIGLAEMGYYDEIIFHRVIKDFMDQTGDPRGDGTGGNSMWGGTFEGGISDGLFHFSGAVAYANSQGTSTNSSQFYIVNTEAVAPDYTGIGALPGNVKAKYDEVGGVPYLDTGYTVFGQVFEGLDVVRAIGAVPVDGNDKPLTQVVMESVTIETYAG